MRRERRQDFILLTRRDPEVIERASELGRDLVELLWSDVEPAVGLFEAERGASWLRGCEREGATGTAVVIYPILKRQSEIGAVSYVSARLVEDMFIAIGIISLLTFLLMRQQATAGTDAGLGEAFVAIYDRAFLIGPGIFAGIANGLILGYLMYRNGLVPRWMATLGLIGGTLLPVSGIAIMFDLIEPGSSLQAIATIPEFFWELSLGIYLIVKGFRPAPILAMEREVRLPESPSAVREGF